MNNTKKPASMQILMIFVIIFSLLILPARTIKVLASTFTTNTFIDSVDVNAGDGICADSAGLCSLRAAIIEANALPGLDTVNLQTGTYLLTRDGSDFASAVGSLDINDNVKIVGQGASNTKIDFQPITSSDNVFYIDSTVASSASFSGLSIFSSNARCFSGIANNNTTISAAAVLNDINISQCQDALFLYDLDSSTITSSVFENNAFTGITLSNVSSILTNVSTLNNSSEGIKIFNDSNSRIVRINDSKIQKNGNPSSFGGGIVFAGDCSSGLIAPDMYLKNVDISENIASFGGGILSTCGHLSIDSTTIANNNVSIGDGGGISASFVASRSPASLPTAFIEIKNSTISGNIAGSGGAISIDAVRSTPATVPYSLDILNSTIADNSSGISLLDGSGGPNLNPLSIRFINTLLSGNGVQNCDIDNAIVVAGSNNLSSDGSCSGQSSIVQKSTLPTFLDGLQNNGNIVRTHALLAGSPAIDAGTNTNCPSTDQRLSGRPSGSLCDVGSFEYQRVTTPANGTFQGTIFNDLNNNGLFDAGDTAIPNIIVEILDSTNTVILSVTNDPNGVFSGTLPPGNYTYRIKQVQPAQILSNLTISTGSANTSFTIASNSGSIIPVIGYAKQQVALIRTGGAN
jgi:SdrD B-like domain